MSDSKESKSKTYRTEVIIPAIAIVILAVATTLSNKLQRFISSLFPSSESSFVLTLKLNADSGTNSNILVVLDKKDSVYSDDNGSVIFDKVFKGRHTYAISFNNHKYNYNIFLKRDVTETLPIKSPGIKQINTNDINKNKDSAGRSNNQSYIAKALPESRKGFFEKLILHAHIDYSDTAYLHNNLQYSYKYYVTGDPNLLSRITRVYYQRVGVNFDEHDSTWQVGSNRKENFQFSDYQWQKISKVWIFYDEKNGSSSPAILMPIHYE